MVTITNDDDPSLSVGDVSVAENVSSGKATVTVSINRATNEEVTVKYATSNGTAAAGSDYTSAGRDSYVHKRAEFGGDVHGEHNN